MRRVLLFLAVFGVGLALIWVATRDWGEPGSETPIVGQPGTRPPDTGLPQTGLPPTDTPDPGVQDLALFRFRGFQSLDTYAASGAASGGRSATAIVTWRAPSKRWTRPSASTS